MNDNQLGVIREWYSVQEELRRVKKHESELRKEIIDFLLEDKTSGVKTFELPNEMELKITIPRQTDIDKKSLSDKMPILKSRGLVGEESLFSFKPSVSLNAYKYLTDEDKELVNDIISFKTGSASMKIESKKSS